MVVVVFHQLKNPDFFMEKKVDSYLNDRSTELSSLVHKSLLKRKSTCTLTFC